MDHDQNFKNLILGYPRQALELFAPDEMAHIDDSVTITPMRQQMLKQKLSGNYRELDTPLIVEWPDGRREALVFVLEEETQSGKFSIYRLAHYCLDIAQLAKTTRVVPVVIFLNGESPDKSIRLGGDRHEFLNFCYLTCALSSLPWLDHINSNNIVARLNLPNMSFQDDEKVDVYGMAVRGLMSLESDPRMTEKFVEFIDIYANLSDTERKLYEHKYPEEAKQMTGFAERFRNEGLNQGINQGEVEMLLRLMESKFGVIDLPTKQQIQAADSGSIAKWSLRLLTANNVAEVLH